MEKKLLKQTAAAVLLSSSLLSFTPPAYGKTTTIQQSIESVKLEMKKAATSYVYPALDGGLALSSSLYPILNSVKNNYQTVRKAIVSSKLSEKEKDIKLKEIDTLYNEKITKGLIPYIDAYNYATKYLDPILKEIKEAEEKNDLAAVEKAYHKLSVQLKSRTSILYRFSGKASRDLLLDKYKEPADNKRDELMVPVTIFMKVSEADKLLAEGKKEEAKKVLESITDLISKLPTPESSTYISTLIKEVGKVQQSAGITPAKPAPNAGNESGGSGGVGSDYTPPSNNNDGSGTTVTQISGSIDNLTDQNVTINGKAYKIAQNLKELFAENNKTALSGATIAVEVNNGEINKVTKLELNNNGHEELEVVLDAKGAVITGAVVVNGDYNTVKNLTVNGDFTISNKVKHSFASDKLHVSGKTSIEENREVAKFASLFAMDIAEKPKTRITITFKDSTMAVIEIAKEDVNFWATGSTEITTLSLFANSAIFADEDVILPRVEIRKGVTNIELNATIQNVVIDSNDELAISGSGNFEKVEINTDKEVTLNTTGAVKNLEMKNEKSNVSIGNNTVVGNIKVQEGKTASEVVNNFEQSKDKIDQIAGQQNPDFNEELREKFNTEHFAVGILTNPNRFGYVKLNIKNQGKHTVKYTFKEKHYPKPALPKIGERVPEDAMDYKVGEEFIAWNNYDIVAYQVNESGIIVDVVDVEEIWHFPIQLTFNEDNSILMKTTINAQNKSVSDLMRNFYFYQNENAYKVRNFAKYKWEFNDGLASLQLKFDGIEASQPSLYFINGTGFGVSSTLNNGYADEKLHIFALYDMLDDEYMDYQYNSFNILSMIMHSGFYDPNNMAESNSVSVEAYKKELRDRKAELQSYKSIKEMIIEVNTQIKETVDAYKLASEAVNNLFKEDRYDYPIEEQIREGVTQADIDNALRLVNNLETGFKEKESLKWSIIEAERLLLLPQIKKEVITTLNVPFEAEVGSILTPQLYLGELPEKINMRVITTGQRIQQSGSESYVVHGSRFIEAASNELKLKALNNTGKPVVEYVEVEFYNGGYFIGKQIIEVTINPTDYDDITLSDIADLLTYGFTEKVYGTSSIDNERKLHIYQGATKQQVLEGIRAVDFSNQTYSITNEDGVELADEDVLNEGAKLTVTSESGKASSTYIIQFIILLEDIQKGSLGEITFTANNTNVEELQTNLKFLGINSVVNEIEGVQDRYKINIIDALENKIYSFIINGGNKIFHSNKWHFSWGSFSVERDFYSPYNNLLIKHDSITALEDISVMFKAADDTTWSESIEVDGVSIYAQITDVDGGQGTVKFRANGSDLNDVNEVRSYNVKVTVDGLSNEQTITLHVHANGEISISLME